MKYQNLKAINIPSSFNGKNKFKVQIWYLVWFLFFKSSPHFLNKFRCILLKMFGANIGQDVKIRPSAYISYPWNITIGAGSFIGDNVYIDSLCNVSIGSDVSLSNNVYLTTGTHDYKSIRFDLILKEIVISDDVWVCVNSTILPGSQLGSGAIIGAASLIGMNKLIPNNEIWAGNPAMFIKERV